MAHFLRLDCSVERKDSLVVLLWEDATTGIAETDLPGGRCELRAFFDRTFEPGEAYRAYDPRWELEPDIDWEARTRAVWPGWLVGKRWFVAPPWNTDPVPEGRIRLRINPGIGFGTGADVTTQLCLEALENEVRSSDSVLDFGAGSGILALAAWALGAKRVVACDLDWDAIASARTDLPGAVAIFAGSIRSVRGGSVDLLLANLNAETVAGHAMEMRRVLTAGGRAIVSGVSQPHGERVRKALTAHGMPPREVVERDTWLRFVC